MVGLAPQRVVVDGTPVAYWESGSGAPLLFVHGYFLTSRTWRKVIPALASSHRCIAVDLLGVGETRVDPAADLSIPAQTRMLSGFLDALDLTSVGLIAHDSGAVLTRQLAVERPDRVARLVLSDTELPHCPVRSAHVMQKAVQLPGLARAYEALLGSRWFFASLLLRAGIHDRSRLDSREFLAVHLEPLRSPQARRAARRFGVQWDLEFVDSLPHERLRMPKLVLWGEKDAFLSPRRAREFCDELPEPKKFVSIPGSGTLPHEECPAAWLEAVGAFLSETDVGP